MAKQSVYLETSVVSYLAARPSRDLILAAHQQITHDWWDNRRMKFELFVSALMLQEASVGDRAAAQRRLGILEPLHIVEITPQVSALAQIFVQEGAIPSTAKQDALHLALATIHQINYLVTWNQKHIANATMRAHIEKVCKRNSYVSPIICTPEQI